MAGAVTGEALLRRGHAVVIGLGGLGVPASVGLAAAGISRLTLVDADRIELSNLHRQLLYAESDIGSLKVWVAAARLQRDHPTLRVAAIAQHVDATNVAAIIDEADVVVDSVDDEATKFVLNDACVRAGIPLCHAGAIGWRGQLFLVRPGHTACLRCLFVEPPRSHEALTCERAGVLGPVVGVLGALQAAEAWRVIDQPSVPPLRQGSLLLFDGRTGGLRQIATAPDPQCPVCGAAKSEGSSAHTTSDDSG